MRLVCPMLTRREACASQQPDLTLVAAGCPETHVCPARLQAGSSVMCAVMFVGLCLACNVMLPQCEAGVRPNSIRNPILLLRENKSAVM